MKASIRQISRIFTLALAAACLLGLPGCKSGVSGNDLTMLSSTEAQDLIAGKRKWLGLGGPGKAVWVDPRTSVEYRAGHIPGAISLPYEYLSHDHKQLDDYDTLIVYGEDYNDAKAIGFSKRLIEFGHSDVRTLNGGLRAWKAAGNSLETGDAKN
jgi:rhodanese-related sulfurtransferase